MPRIPDLFLNCVFYLYPTVEDANAGRNAGGTGFLASIKSKANETRAIVFAVTNWHVACRGSSVARIMRKDGQPDIFPYGPEDWFFDPDGSDVAIVPIATSHAVHHCAYVPIDGPFTAAAHLSPIGVGDDVFMIGRFVDHDGGEINRPTVRFGNISMMPTPILQENGNKRDAYCLDMHSRSGYSGSPVFVYRTSGGDLNELLEKEKQGQVLLSGQGLLLPLGIHIGQFPEVWKLKGRKVRATPAEAVELNATEQHIEGVSGMTCVVPMSAVAALLERQPLKKMIEEAELRIAQSAQSSAVPKAEGSEQ